MIRVNANLFRIVHLAASKEETRYYLQGVFVEPHPDGGVTMVATDGHKLLAAYDANGVADEAATIKLPPAALKECKPSRHDKNNTVRVVSVPAGGNAATVGFLDADGELHEIMTTPGVRVDGTFPDWRAILPKPATEEFVYDVFAASILEFLGTVGKELSTISDAMRGSDVPMRISSGARGAPALVTWPSIPHVFGVAMVMRSENSANPVIPSWATVRPKL